MLYLLPNSSSKMSSTAYQTPILTFLKSHKPSIDAVCYSAVFRSTSAYIVLVLAALYILWNFSEMIKNLTIRTCDSTMYTITRWNWFIQHPMYNFKLKEVNTLYHGACVYSAARLIWSLLDHDYVSQINYIQSSLVLCILKWLTNLINPYQSPLYYGIEVSYTLASFLVWTGLLCNVHQHFGVMQI